MNTMAYEISETDILRVKNPLAGERLRPLGHLSTDRYTAGFLRFQAISGIIPPIGKLQNVARTCASFGQELVKVWEGLFTGRSGGAYAKRIITDSQFRPPDNQFGSSSTVELRTVNAPVAGSSPASQTSSRDGWMTLLLSRRPLNVHAKQTVTGSGYRFCHQGARPNKPCPRHFLPNFMREQHGKQTCRKDRQ